MLARRDAGNNRAISYENLGMHNYDRCIEPHCLVVGLPGPVAARFVFMSAIMLPVVVRLLLRIPGRHDRWGVAVQPCSVNVRK